MGGMSRADLADARKDLRANCSRCAALCCVAPSFAVSADFAIDKPAGVACPNLREDFACDIHPRLRDSGFPGCAVFDCFGAGQHVVQATFAGRDWRTSPEIAAPMFAVFTVMRQLKELLWYLREAVTLVPAGVLRERIAATQRSVEALVDASADEVARVDGATLRRDVSPLLQQASEQARAGVRGRRRDRPGADLIQAKLRRADLRGVSLRGAYLLGADLRDADLTRADLLGADLRAADLRGARLADSLFLTQPQVDAGVGDGTTTIPPFLTRPRHWTG